MCIIQKNVEVFEFDLQLFSPSHDDWKFVSQVVAELLVQAFLEVLTEFSLPGKVLPSFTCFCSFHAMQFSSLAKKMVAGCLINLISVSFSLQS